jgi:hypothetical protein
VRRKAATDEQRSTAKNPLTIGVERTRRGTWDVRLPDQHEPVTCETLDDTKRIAYKCAAHRHICELTVCDMSRRELHHEFINGGAGSPSH